MEDYKEKYEQAMLRMNKWVEGSEITDPKEVAEFVFPELKESEDEVMKGKLREILRLCYTVGNSSISTFDYETLLTWLEKQGEQKPADKVEPKFKVGDWIINSKGMLRHIVDVDKTGYQTDNGWLTHDFYEKRFHLWTIQDAKEGDVLSFDNEGSNYHSIGIFKRIASKNEPNGNTYRCYVRYGGFNEVLEIPINGDELHHSGTSAHPATKEQRDLLFQKMKEAGYEWDSEKKELKEIEQKIIEIPFGTDSELVEETITIPNGCYAVIEDNKVILRKGEQKTAWSEEDEIMIEDIIETIDTQYAVSDYNDMVSWLKSLKERMKGE